MKNVGYLFLLMVTLHSCKEASVMDIKTIHFDKDSVILFGQSQDVMVTAMPDSTLSVKYNTADSSFWWTISKPVYLKIEGETQNAVLLDSIRMIQIGNAPSFEFSRMRLLAGNFSDRSDGVKYIKLSNLIRSVDTTIGKTAEGMNSLVACDEDGKESQPKLILLDTSIVVTKLNGESISFRPTNHKKTKNLSLEFFRIFNSVLLDPGSSAFHIADTVYYAAVKSFYTPFGASKFELSADEKVNISFNRYYRTVIPKSVIGPTFNKNNNITVSIKQQIQSNTYSNEIYTGNFSNSNALDLGSIDSTMHFFKEKANPLLSDGDLYFFNINKYTFFYYLVPLLVVFIFGLFVIRYVTKDSLHEGEPNHGENSRWRKYFWILFSLLFVLGIGKIFIGYNLAFTPPYYSFALPTSAIIAPLVLLTVLYIWVIFIVDNNIDTINFKFRLSLIVCAGILIAGLYKFVVVLFPFYVSQFHETFQWLHPQKNEVYYQSIVTLVAFIGAITVAMILAKGAKFIFILSCLVLGVLFFIQKSSYSVSALLLVILMLNLIVAGLFKYIKLGFESKYWQRVGRFLLLVIPLVLVFCIAKILKHDGGYFINLLLFPLIIAIVIFAFYRFYPTADSGIDKQKTKKQLIGSIFTLVSLVGILSFTAFEFSRNYNPLEHDRMRNRFTSFFDFSSVHSYGTRESEKQAQFFAELSKYAYPTTEGKYEPIHPGISSYIDPVVKNDLSVPFGLIYQFGPHWFYLPVILLVLIWACLLYAVLRISIAPVADSGKHRYFTQSAIIRIYCVCGIVSSGLWLIASYYSIVPFTGRLIYGLGQDSIAEVFETVFLFGYMGLVRKSKN